MLASDFSTTMAGAPQTQVRISVIMRYFPEHKSVLKDFFEDGTDRLVAVSPPLVNDLLARINTRLLRRQERDKAHFRPHR